MDYLSRNLVSDTGKGYTFAGKLVSVQFGLFWTWKQLIVDTTEQLNQLELVMVTS